MQLSKARHYTAEFAVARRVHDLPTSLVHPTIDGISTMRNTASSKSTESVSRWRLVRTCKTLEYAQRLVRQLNERGMTASICMVDGLSVIAR